ncbi:nucleotidyl transferase AbiEii/AbiGii toxin family protein [Steroidobacter sp.]|uniref:nucleotidyl transferase AbiEii/AbiGii toxin family protein n=1 Tax=Steroidobacter sp. TaxID=1978227 RepID=UPI001A40906F|nr:nucleotidyl transferase AbiEii/AbiGii toxin family protein [Steroidobacter sp.]MBL8268076.1 nucleotidyl transferase AbiEii/AbiGii toxin family protein [Steroidobacter sp.]
MPIRLHENNPSLFLEALSFTAAETGFLPRLIEKDYFCSVVLEDLAALDTALVFKGGTLLAKVHSGFYRLSEDLDFSICTAVDATKKQRSQAVAAIKPTIASIASRLPGLRVDTPLTGSNGSTQYNAVLSYPSVLAEQRETIKVEIGLREPVVLEPERLSARTLLMNPVRTGTALLAEFSIVSLNHLETMAEKLRAALCRREVAIRDFFDIDHAVSTARFDTAAAELLALLRRKIAVNGTGAVDLSAARYDQLTAQLEAQLRPVLRSKDFERFDLERAFSTVVKAAQAL